MIVRIIQLMYEITLGENAAYRLPALDFRGMPTSIDKPPLVCFERAVHETAAAERGAA